MTEKEFQRAWDYYLTLESDLDNTSRYVEPQGQLRTYSFEFAKLLILSCVELEAGFKNMCKSINNRKKAKNMYDYRTIILGKYPHIVAAEANISRWGKTIKPFRGWTSDPHATSCGLGWWESYNDVKHSIEGHLKDATYKNVCYALSALHIFILYLGEDSNIDISYCVGNYIKSPYVNGALIVGRGKNLPDFP